MNDEQLLRYSRQLMLPDVDVAGQEKLLAARVLVVGIGGLGAPAALYLAAAGVGTLLLADHDRVELPNLQRQIIHGTADVGRPKAVSARERIHALDPHVNVIAHVDEYRRETLERDVGRVDLVVDCTDNAASRYALNDACRAAQVPWVSAAAIRFEGQLTVFDPRREDSPCYACLYPEPPTEETTCAEAGVIGPLVGVLGSLQALEAVKVLTGAGTPLVGRLTTFDGRSGEWLTLRLPRRAACPVCGPGGNPWGEP